MKHPDWHRRAACRGVEQPDIFFPGPNENTEREAAIAMCNTCPVADDCHDWADTHQPSHGIWGGEPQRARHERQGITLSAAISHDPWLREALAPVCGTAAAYRRHMRNDEPACRPCQLAIAAEQAARRNAPTATTQPHTMSHQGDAVNE